MTSNKKVFLTFGGPTDAYHNAVKRVTEQARQSGFFDEVIGLTETYIKGKAKFWRKHGDFIEKNTRGYGYWIWKPYIIKKVLKKMKENDILVWADAGCTINSNGRERMMQYYDMVTEGNESGILSFHLCNLAEKNWSKRSLADYLDANEHMQSDQIITTSFVLRKCKHSVKLVNLWYKTCCHYDLVNDSHSSGNYYSFREHRHDQSIFSLLCKKYGSLVIKDETYFRDFKRDGNNSPIWATRQRSS